MKIKRRKELNINFYCSKLKIKMILIEHIKAVEKASQYSDFYSGFA